jgi:SAM-dependent methyltransferase
MTDSDVQNMKDLFRQAAPYYDEDYASIGYTADVGFYVDLATQIGGPVLEMGCGTGRVLLPTARAGIPIHGMDLSPEMLEQLRQKLANEPKEVQRRVSFSVGDVRSTAVDGRFALITAPFSVLQALLEREDQRAWLRNVKRHLAPGGSLCFDVFQPDYRRLSDPQGPFSEVERVDAAGRKIRRIGRTWPRPEFQAFEIDLDWQVERDGTWVSEGSVRFKLRWFTKAELENLLELEGFRVADYWGSFDRQPFGAGSQQQVVRATC